MKIIDTLLSLPDVVLSNSAPSNVAYKRVLSKSVNDAIYDLIKMRSKEGNNLSKDIQFRLKKIKKDLALIIKISERTQKEILKNYRKKIKLLFDNNSKIILLSFLTAFLIGIRTVGLLICFQYLVSIIILFNIKKININNISVEKINDTKYRLFAGPFENFNALKSIYISLNNLGFESLNIYND